jgi:formate/nitrite transporter FocA (FNT family)
MISLFGIIGLFENNVLVCKNLFMRSMQHFLVMLAILLASSCFSGAAKLENSFLREVVLGVMAGAYIGFGFSLCMLCAGQVRPEQLPWERGLAEGASHS